MFRFGLLMVLAVVAWSVSMPQASANPEAGEKVATKHCAGCHVVGAKNQWGGIGSTPSFWLMAKKPESYIERLKTFAARRPHVALKLPVTNEEIDDLIAYVRNLKKP